MLKTLVFLRRWMCQNNNEERVSRSSSVKEGSLCSLIFMGTITSGHWVVGVYEIQAKGENGNRHRDDMSRELNQTKSSGVCLKGNSLYDQRQEGKEQRNRLLHYTIIQRRNGGEKERETEYGFNKAMLGIDPCPYL